MIRDEDQAGLRDFLRQKAARRKPALEKALVKAEEKIARIERLRSEIDAIKVPSGDAVYDWARENQKAVNFLRLAAKYNLLKRSAAEYRADLKLIAEGSFHGDNGLPFGAVPGINRGFM